MRAPGVGDALLEAPRLEAELARAFAWLAQYVTPSLAEIVSRRLAGIPGRPPSASLSGAANRARAVGSSTGGTRLPPTRAAMAIDSPIVWLGPARQ